ncbi:MAG: AAA family ATPase [Magnetococcus sp. DMHC-6]
MAESQKEQSNPIARIKKMELNNFKGFVGSHEVNVDADLVLLTGSNGYGKSSFLEALQLLLTRWHPYKKKSDTMITVGKDSSFISINNQEGKDSFSLSLERGKEKIIPSNSYPPYLLQSNLEQKQTSDLEARICCFFQDRVQYLFDEFSTGRTLRDIFEPVPEYWKTFDTKLLEIANQVDNYINTYTYKMAVLPSSQDKIIYDYKEFSKYLRLLKIELDKKWPEIPETIMKEEELAFLAVEILQIDNKPLHVNSSNLIETFEQTIIKEVERCRNRAKINNQEIDKNIDLYEKVQKKIIETEKSLTKISNDFPTLDKDVHSFDATENGQPDLLAVFHSLAHNSKRWSCIQIDSKENSRFQRILEELAAVSEEEARKCATTLAVWLTPRREAFEQKQELEQKKQNLENELKKLEKSKKFGELSKLKEDLEKTFNLLKKSWEKERERLQLERKRDTYVRAVEELNIIKKSLDILKDAFEKMSRPNEPLRKDIEKIINLVLGRFSLVEGILPVTLDCVDENVNEEKSRRYVIKAKNGRAVNQLSTGQRTQMAVSFLVGQNHAISQLLPHRIIILDDVSTSYDLANLTREAILWRQLAYGEDKEHPYLKRQIFISSHHEDMTNKLLDLLAPPAGSSMRYLRFTDWSPEKGPTIEQMKILPTEKTDGVAMERLIRRLKERKWSTN